MHCFFFSKRKWDPSSKKNPQKTELKTNMWETNLRKSELIFMGAMSGPDEWFMQSHYVMLTNAIALWAHKPGMRWTLRWVVLLLDKTNSEDWRHFSGNSSHHSSQYHGIVLNLFCLHSPLRAFGIASVAFHSYGIYGEHLRREKSFKKNYGPQNHPGGKNKTKIKAVFEIPVSLYFPTCQLLF